MTEKVMAEQADIANGRRNFFRLGCAVLCTSGVVSGFAMWYGTGGNKPKQPPVAKSTSFTTSTSTPKPMTPFNASEHDRIKAVTPIEKEIHRLTNDARKEQGVGTVEWSDDLAYVARDHSRDMAQRGYFSHENPEGEHVWHRVEKYGLDFSSVGENIAGFGGIDTMTTQEMAEQTITMWMNSESHQEILLDPQWSYEGVGIYLTETGLTATQVFG